MPIDSSGIWIYEETDVVGLFSDLLNLLADTTSIQVGALKAAAAELGIFQTYAPTLSGITLGSGDVDAVFTRIGDLVKYEVLITLAADSEVTGTIEIGVPVSGAAVEGFVYPMGEAIARTGGASGSNVYKGQATNGGSGAINQARLLTTDQSPGAAWNDTTPFTWGTGASSNIDGALLSVRGDYRVPPA